MNCCRSLSSNAACQSSLSSRPITGTFWGVALHDNVRCPNNTGQVTFMSNLSCCLVIFLVFFVVHMTHCSNVIMFFSLSSNSAGIGRTGIFLALDIMMQGLVYDETTVDVYGTVSSLRKQRCCMVQTVVCTWIY